MSYKSYRELECWKESRKLVKEIYRLVKLLPPEELFALSDQMRRAVISVPSNIAEGHGRNSKKEFVKFLSYATGSLCELDAQCIAGLDLGYFKKDDLIESMNIMKNIRRMIFSLSSYLKKSLDKEEHKS